MAMLDTINKTGSQLGLSWAKQSLDLFKTAPRKWISLALVYVGLFMMLPSIPGLQIFALISILIWPVFLAIATMMYRDADMKKQQNLSQIVQHIQPKISQLIGLGAACLLYVLLVSLLLNSDLEGLANVLQNKDKMTEAQVQAFVQKMLPVLLKLTFLLIPMMMATWFAPMLIAFNQYPLIKALKSSVAGSIQYMVALGAACLVLTLGVIFAMLLVGTVAGFVGALVPLLGQLLMPFVLFGCLLLATALMLAFQYISYRDVFRAA